MCTAVYLSDVSLNVPDQVKIQLYTPLTTVDFASLSTFEPYNNNKEMTLKNIMYISTN